MTTGATVIASVASDGTQANGPSTRATVSGDGRVVAFISAATNLDRRDAGRPIGPAHEAVFVHDIVTGKTALVSGVVNNVPIFWGDPQRPMISANARVIVFQSTIEDLVPGDTNHFPDIFAYEFSSAPWLP